MEQFLNRKFRKEFISEKAFSEMVEITQFVNSTEINEGKPEMASTGISSRIDWSMAIFVVFSGNRPGRPKMR